MKTNGRTLLAVFLLAAAGFAPSGAWARAAAPVEAYSVHPVSGLPVIPLTIASAGKLHTFRVEVALTEPQQALGLMFRTAMAPNEGMIFPMRPPRLANFWMHDTVLPLDIIFVGTDGRIMTIAANAVPYDDTNLPSGGVAMGVLELNGGRAAQLGIKIGDKVSW